MADEPKASVYLVVFEQRGHYRCAVRSDSVTLSDWETFADSRTAFRLMRKGFVAYLQHPVHVSKVHLNYSKYGGYDGTLTLGRPQVR